MSLRSNLQQLAEIDGSRLKEIRKDRVFKMPKNYPSWDYLTKCMLLTNPSILDWGAKDRSTAGISLLGHLWKEWMDSHAPLYCISSELIDQYLHTDTSNLKKIIPEDWNPPVPLFLMALPSKIITSPDGCNISYMIVSLDDNLFYVEWLNDKNLGIGIAFCDEGGTVTACFGNPLKHEVWIRNLFSIALQAAMTISYIPDLITEPEERCHGVKSKYAKSKNVDRMLRPRWIGKDFVRASSGPSMGGTHARPSTHWRRGHWRNQPVGEGRKNRTLVWVRPSIICGNNVP